jgi:hypothetical protein
VTTAPPVRRPQDLPDLRLWLLDQWQPGHPFDMAAAAAIGPEGYGPYGIPTTPGWDRAVIREASLWWVSAPMVDLLEAAAAQLPGDYTLTDELVPDHAGLVIFERPLMGLDAMESGHVVQVDGFAWGGGHLIDRRNARTCSVQTYRRFALDMGLSPAELQMAVHSGAMLAANDRAASAGGSVTFTTGNEADVWAWLGRTDWVFGDSVEAPVVPSIPPGQAASHAEDRRWLAALWLLASQRNLTADTTEHPGRPVRRRSQRAGVDATVRIIDLRRPRASDFTGEAPEGPGEHRDVHWSRQWVVGGHWRNQAWGPGHRWRRPVWIAPYVKGPEGKPLVVRPTVKVVR